ncbi:MAG TPA: DUF3500 domain-containing protein [Polyangiaceae bacterium]
MLLPASIPSTDKRSRSLGFGLLLFTLCSCGGSGGDGGPSNVAGRGSQAGSGGSNPSIGGAAPVGGSASPNGGSSPSGGSAGANTVGGSGGSDNTAGEMGVAGAAAGASPGGSGAGGAVGAGQGGQGSPGGQAGQGGTSGGGGAPGMKSCAEMVSAAKAFLDAIGPSGAIRDRALMDFDERIHFKFTPGDRPGVPLRDLSEAQRQLALALVATGLSESGFTKAEVTRQNELVLRAQENSDSRDPLGYFLAIYGTPATDGSWAWQWEGHHLSLHFTLADCTRVASAPTFYGANPAQVATSVAGGPPMGTRNLGREEDLARQLAGVLDMDATKRAQAIVANQLRDTPETTSVSRPQPAGLLASAMSRAEQDMLRTLIAEYANNLAPELAAERLSRIEDAGLDGVSFLWSGSLMRGQAHYYRVQGPTFLIEYANEQNNANHVHTAWRDFDGDYGRDLIAEHRLAHPH